MDNLDIRIYEKKQKDLSETDCNIFIVVLGAPQEYIGYTKGFYLSKFTNEKYSCRSYIYIHDALVNFGFLVDGSMQHPVYEQRPIYEYMPNYSLLSGENIINYIDYFRSYLESFDSITIRDVNTVINLFTFILRNAL